MFWRPHAAMLQLLFLCIGTSVRYCDGFMLPTSRIQPLRCDLSMVIVVPEKDRRLDFNFIGKIAFSLVPLSPESIGRRKTIFTEVVPGKVWTLDQVRHICHNLDLIVKCLSSVLHKAYFSSEILYLIARRFKEL
jgi:hypothetical protein